MTTWRLLGGATRATLRLRATWTILSCLMDGDHVEAKSRECFYCCSPDPTPLCEGETLAKALGGDFCLNRAFWAKISSPAARQKGLRPWDRA